MGKNGNTEGNCRDRRGDGEMGLGGLLWSQVPQGGLVEDEVEELSEHKVLEHPVYPLPSREQAARYPEETRAI